nr:hypothetical protein [Tanacetum cinerariifolium]
MDVKSAFLYGTIEEEVYVCQPLGFEDLNFPNKVYKVEKALYGLHQAPRAWYETLSTYLLENRFRRGIIDKTFFIKNDKGLQVMQKDDGIFISQYKYVADILKKFDFSSVKTTSTLIETNKALLKDEEAKDVDVHLYRSMIGSLMYLTASRLDIMFVVCACARFQVTPKVSHLHAMRRIFRYLKCQPKLGLWYPMDSQFNLEAFSDSDYDGASLDRKSTTGVKTTSTLIETNKALLKDEEAKDVDVHLYRSMIGSLMYLTASRLDIMFVVCACARFQVTPKVSHLHAMRRIFRYLKCQPKLGLWYPMDSPFNLEAFTDSDYAGAGLDRKSTTGGCQFLGKRPISWQYKKQIVVANSITEANYVAAANCCGQVL